MMLHILDITCLWVIWWCCFAALTGGHEVRTFRALILQLALIVVMVSAFIGAISVYMTPGSPPVWIRGLIYGFAAVSAWLYDYRFGIARHVRMAVSAALNAPHRAREALGRLHRRVA